MSMEKIVIVITVFRILEITLSGLAKLMIERYYKNNADGNGRL